MKHEQVTTNSPEMGRYAVLQLAEALGNVSEACRRAGMDRTSFYEWRRRFQSRGLDGLKNLPPIHKYHPHATVPQVVDRILAISLDHPHWGCARIASQLKSQNVSISSPTIQNILIKHGLGSKHERFLRLEERHLADGYSLSADQLRCIENANPCFRARSEPASRPGELLVQHTLFIGYLEGLGRVYMQAVVDTYSSHAFGRLYPGKAPEHAIEVLSQQTLPYFRERGLAVTALASDDSRVYGGAAAHPFGLYLSLNRIEHRRLAARRASSHGFMERFVRTIQEEFFCTVLLERAHASLATLQDAQSRWLAHYNNERPHRGYRNLGRPPHQAVEHFLAAR